MSCEPISLSHRFVMLIFSSMTQILTRFKAFVKTIQDNLTDLHDPSGEHWHRAVNATGAAAIAAFLLMLNPTIIHPLAIISTLIFSHTNKGSQLSQQKRSQLLSLGITLIGVFLLTLVQGIDLAQFIVIILLSFLAEYTTKFGSEYGFKLVLILCLIVTKGENLRGNIPLVLLNIGIGFGLAYLFSCQLFPYGSQKALRMITHRVDQRLAELLAKIVIGKNTNFLKRRLFSLLQTQSESLTKFSYLITEQNLARFSYQMSLFDALIILERSLLSGSDLPDLQFLNQMMAADGKEEARSPIPPIEATREVHRAVQALVTMLEGEQSLVILSLPPKPKKIPPQFWDFTDAIAHQALRSAIAVALALVIGRGFHLPYGDWIVISALIVSQDAVGNTIRKSYGRIWGTITGLIATVVLVAVVFHHHSFVVVLAFLSIFPYLYLRPSLNNYGYAKFFEQIAVISFVVLIGEQATPEFMEWRIGNIILGCVIGQGVSFFVFPHWSRDSWKNALVKALADCQTLFQATAQAEQSIHWDTERLSKLSYQACCSVYQMASRLESRQQELKLKGEQINHRWDLINVNRVLYEAILYWGFTVKTDLSTSNPPAPGEAQLITNIDQALTLLQNNVGFQVVFDQSLIPEMPESLSPLQKIAEAIADYAIVKNRYTYPKKIPL